MKQFRLLTLLALLMTAATGAWATPNSIVINGTPQVGDKSISLTYYFDPANVPGITSYAPTLKVKCAADNKWDEMNLSLTEVSSGTTNISLSTLGEFEAGKTYDVCFAYNNGNWVDEVFQSFVPAAAGYTVSLKDGVKDADKWTVKVGEGQAQALPIGGLKGDGSETVTLQYNGRLKVKGVKATSEAAAPSVPDGALSGVFSVSSTKKVYFSKGNLRYASGAWSFFDNQYDYYDSYSADAWDKFGWSTSATTYGMNTSTDNSTYSGDFVDWGATMGAGWFTLSKDEWTYLLDTRTVNGGTGDGKSYTKGQSVNGKPGVVIYPDNYTGEVYSGSDWATFESAGCVFLPAAGSRGGSSLGYPGTRGSYWSASPNGTDDAYFVYFTSGYPIPASSFNRFSGASVRLVREVATSDAAPAAAAFAADEYNEASWDDTNKKVVFEKKKATTTPVAVADATTDVTWDAGWYTVSGNVTINGKVTLGDDTHLILQDGATLTINGQLKANQKNLYIYGQKKGDGKLIVTTNSATAISSNKHIDIHGGEVTAEATGGLNTGLSTGYLAVYGGKLTATSGSAIGLGFNNTIDVYGGEVVATSNATSSSTPWYGILSNGSSDSKILTVYGGKVTATGNGQGDYGSGFGCYVKSGTSGIKFYFSADGTTWGDGTSYTSATKVGRSDSDATTKKRYAKAE